MYYYMDYVQGLFLLCWGVGDLILVYGLLDEQGCDDLFKYLGLFDFSYMVELFVVFDLQGLQVMFLLFNYLKLIFGYLLEMVYSWVVWLFDIVGLLEKMLKFLCNNQLQVMVMDCSYLLCVDVLCNYCDLNIVFVLNQVICLLWVILIYISYQFDVWLMENVLLLGFEVGFDGMEIGVV